MHKLKIDMSFVRDMLGDRNDYSIVSAIVAIGRSLDLEILAEGVEHAKQAEVLLALGCRQAQGYLFGRPEPTETFSARWFRGRDKAAWQIPDEYRSSSRTNPKGVIPWP